MKIVALLVLVGLLTSGAIIALRNGTSHAPTQPKNMPNVSMVDGKQIIEITAKGGYQPSASTAKAGIPTVIRFNTHGTFDCSASVRIPRMNISEMLPSSGAKDIDIGSPQAGTLEGTCGMGMYPFKIDFQS